MTHLRRTLAPVTAVWLLCQLGAAASVPMALWITAADPHGEECTCGHDGGVICPMHHKSSGRPVRCAMQATNSSGTAVLTTLVGVAGLISESTLSIRSAEPPIRTVPNDVRIAGERPVPPDPPPPRA